MQAEEFRAACQILFARNSGALWGAAEAADALQVNPRNVYYWAAGTKPVPPGVADDLCRMLREALNDQMWETPHLNVLRSALRHETGTQAA